MKNVMLIAGIAGSLLLSSGAAVADGKSNYSNHKQTKAAKAPVRQDVRLVKINNELVKQNNLIKSGVKYGSLTSNESRQLLREQTVIKQALNQMKRNGISRAEDVNLSKRLSTASRNIYKEMHDREVVKVKHPAKKTNHHAGR